MRKTPSLEAGIVVLTALINATSFAESAPPNFGPGFITEGFQKYCADEEALFKARVAFTEVKLDLQQGQRPNWETFVAEAHAAGQPIRSLCKEQTTTFKRDAVANLDLLEKGLSALLEAHRSFATAVKKFAPTLQSEQTRVLVELMLVPPPPPPPPPGPPGPHPW